MFESGVIPYYFFLKLSGGGRVKPPFFVLLTNDSIMKEETNDHPVVDMKVKTTYNLI